MNQFVICGRKCSNYWAFHALSIGIGIENPDCVCRELAFVIDNNSPSYRIAHYSDAFSY